MSDFNDGFMLACVNLAEAHGEDAYAQMLLDDAGITPATLKTSKLDREAKAVLRPLLQQSEDARRRETSPPADDR